MELTVDSILLGADGSGLVTFRFSIGEPKEWLLEIPYSNSVSIDEGVKQAAAQLAQCAKALTEDALAARRTSSTCGLKLGRVQDAKTLINYLLHG